jgi:hypothetical protein
MSHIARVGNKAQSIICAQATAVAALGATRIILDQHGKKTDVVAHFPDGSVQRLQVKNTDTSAKTTRGHSVDRRSWMDFVRPLRSLSLRAALHDMTLKQKRVKGQTWLCNLFNRECSSRDESELILRRSLLGDDPDHTPSQFVATRLNSDKTAIIEMSICPTTVLVDHLVSTLYPRPRLVKSCIELGPNIYLQRKGGDKNDSRAADIQTKIKFDASMSHLFTPLPLPLPAPAPQSIAAPPEPVSV